MRMGMKRRKTLEETTASALSFAGAKSFVCAASCAAVLLSGCNVGPKYVKPAAPAPAPEFKEAAPAAYTNPPEGTTPDKTWQPAQPQDAALKGKWWEVFNEPELNALEEQLDINNQNIATYFQNFMAARARRCGMAVAVLSDSWGRRRRTRAVTPAAEHGVVRLLRIAGVTSNNLSLPLDVSWEPDLWGKVRNEVHEAQYATQVSAADLENERLTEQAALAEYYFQLRGQDALQDLYNRTVAADKKSLELTRSLYETGIDLRNDEAVAQAEVTLQGAQEIATGIATNRAIYEHAMATLIGKPASSFSMPVKSLTTPVPAKPVAGCPRNCWSGGRTLRPRNARWRRRMR